MCPNITEFYGPIIWYSIVNSEFSAEKVCQYLHICPKQERDVSRIPQTPLESDSLLKNPTPVGLFESDSTGTVIRFVHISDFHLDPNFKEGAPSTCNFFLCCHDTMTGNNPAGMYGAYGCDLPVTTANLVLNHLATLKDIDFVLYGGDNPPHDLWAETYQSQMDIETSVISMFKKHYPNTPFYPVLGNHESYPESEYLQDLYTNLTETLSRLWSPLAPFPASALKTIGHGGYYTLMLKPKLRLICYNSDYGYLLNFYTLLNHKNHAYVEHTKWLQDTLAQAKKNGEKVLLAAHVPLASLPLQKNMENGSLASRYHILILLLGNYLDTPIKIISSCPTKWKSSQFCFDHSLCHYISTSESFFQNLLNELNNF